MPGGRCRWRFEGPDRNAVLYDTDGQVVSVHVFGDGIAHVLATSTGQVWAGYFDEGIYGNYGWGRAASRRSTFFNADLPPSHGGNTSQAQLATSLWAHNDCIQPLRPPEGVLTDGVVSLRVPSVEDVDAFISYAAGHAGRGL